MPNPQKGSTLILVSVVLLILGAAGGSVYYWFTQNNQKSNSSQTKTQEVLKPLMPEEVLAKAAENFSGFDTIHGDMDLQFNSRVIGMKGIITEQKTTLSGFMDMNLKTQAFKNHQIINVDGKIIEGDGIMLADGTVYIKMSLLGDKWILDDSKNPNMDLKKNVNSSKEYIDQSANFLKTYNKDSIIRLEDEIVDGIKTFHYRFDISTQKFIELTKKNSPKNELAYKNASIQADYWVDQKTYRTVKVVVDIKNIKTYEEKTDKLVSSADGVLTMKFSKFNQELDITKPEGEIIKASNLK